MDKKGNRGEQKSNEKEVEKMINYKTGAVYCDNPNCKKYIGNYFNGTDADGNEKSYHSLIRTKYCQECKPYIVRKQNRNRAHNHRVRERAKKEIIQEQLRLIQAENKALKIKLFGTENAEQTKALIEILKA